MRRSSRRGSHSDEAADRPASDAGGNDRRASEPLDPELVATLQRMLWERRLREPDLDDLEIRRVRRSARSLRWTARGLVAAFLLVAAGTIVLWRAEAAKASEVEDRGPPDGLDVFMGARPFPREYGSIEDLRRWLATEGRRMNSEYDRELDAMKTRRTQALWVAIGVAAATALAFYASIGVERRHQMAMRFAKTGAVGILSRTQRSPVLYLRSFASDVADAKASWRVGVSAEERLCGSLRRIGPVVALGRPGENLPCAGAFRVYAEQEHWQAVFAALLRSARLVAIRPGSSPGFDWEITTLLTSVDPTRVLLFTPRNARRHYQALRRIWAATIGVPLPDQPSRYLAFSPDWRGVVVADPASHFAAYSKRPAVIGDRVESLSEDASVDPN